uniref:Uncharacterized protein n=1 Tax=Glossina austeni TaxID=7395 RepID=A0A1A9VXV5_GLOAU
MIRVGSGSVMLRRNGAGHNLEQPADKSTELKNVWERVIQNSSLWHNFRFSDRVNVEEDLRRERSPTMPAMMSKSIDEITHCIRTSCIYDPRKALQCLHECFFSQCYEFHGAHSQHNIFPNGKQTSIMSIMAKSYVRIIIERYPCFNRTNTFALPHMQQSKKGENFELLLIQMLSCY